MKKTTSTKTAKASKANKATKATPKRKKAATVQPVEAQPFETTKAPEEQKPLTGIALHALILKNVSEIARQIKESLIEEAKTPKQKAYYQARPLNYFILNCVYKGGNKQFKTFEQWQKEGASINKGEKAYVIWGQPKKVEALTISSDQAAEPFLLYPISYVFSNSQVTFRNATI